jgi:hypothetical protein
LECLPADHPLERRDLGLVFLKKISRSGVFIGRAGLKSSFLIQIRIRLRETSWRFARLWSLSSANEFLGDLPFQFGAIGTMLGHGFHPLKARRSRSIPNPQDVHRQGRTALSEN